MKSPTSDAAGPGGSPPPERDGDVFISYAAEDRERARSIAVYLESRGWSVWWDRKIPVGRAFDEAIEDALRRARCVVVLWTKDAVASRWVRSEASDAAQRQVLVPVLVEEVTIPLEFRHLQALDLRAWKPGTAPPALEHLHEAVAGIIGDRPSAATIAAPGFTEPAPRGFLTRSPAVIAGAALLLVVIALGAWYWDAFHREIRDYYANVTKRWGLPEGIGHLTAEQVSQRNESVLVLRRGRRNPAHEVRVINSEGHTPAIGLGLPILSVNELNPLPSAGSDGPVSSELIQLTRVTFTHDANGRLLEQAGFNRGGRRLYTMHFAEPDIAEYKWQGFGTAIRESGISYLRFSRVAGGPNAGVDESVQYLDDKRRPQPDVNGDFGYRLVLDGRGLVTEVVNRGPDGADKANSYGVLKEIRSRDTFGNVVEATTVDDRGAPKRSRVGVGLTRVEYDRSGNPVRMSFFDEKRQPVVAQMAGAASIGYTYDRHGNVTSQTFFGPDQSMVVSALGFAKQTIEWLSPTRLVSRVFGANDQPIPAFGGAFEGLITLDSRGYYVETTYRDRQGNPTRTAEGCATARLQYDELGNIVKVGCLNEQGVPTISTDGSSSVTFTYDAFGNRATSTYYDLQGAPRRLGDSYATIGRTFTPTGLVAEETYLDARGNPVRNRRGFAKVQSAFDAQGNEVATNYLDEHGGRVTVLGGYSAIHRKFDERRLEAEVAYLDSGDGPVPGPDGYATIRYEYDQRGFLTRLLQLDAGGRPSRGFYGYCSARIKHNEAGQRLEMNFYDEQGTPTVAARLGSAKRRWTYDAAGRVSERSDHDMNGRPIINAYGYSILRHRYDEHGRDTGRELLDTTGRPLPFKVGVDRVALGSVASDVGLKVGDLILTYDGQTVSTIDQFTNTFELFRGDRGRELRIERAGNVLSLDVPPGHLEGLELAERVPAATSAQR